MSVYFIYAPPCAAIKIGRSASPAERLRALQTACPVELVLLAEWVPPPVTETFTARRRNQYDHLCERAIHKAFRRARLHNEWFSAEPVLTRLRFWYQNANERLVVHAPLGMILDEREDVAA